MKWITGILCLFTHSMLMADFQEDFWQSITNMKGKSFKGELVVGTEASDEQFMSGEAVMYVWKASKDEIRIPFHIGDDHSRTWVLRKTESGLQLKHDHRKPGGMDDKVTQYGGDTKMKGTPLRQEFHADKYTGDLLPASAKNIWAMEIEPGKRFVYELRREHEDRFFRVEFDLSTEVKTPPPAWGDEERAEDMH